MKTRNYIIPVMLFIAVSCGQLNEDHSHDDDIKAAQQQDGHTDTHDQTVHLTQQQYDALGMKTDTLPMRQMDAVVETNGELEVPPQNEAAVTAIIGANVTEIKVIEGDKITKGQVLAYLSHPNLIKLQTNYISEWHNLQYLEDEYKRQEKLYQEKVGSGKEFQKIKSKYLATRGLVSGYEAQLKQMGLNIDKLRNGELYERVPVRSPLSGNVVKVEVKTGQYVQPETEMFSLVNIDHIHADFMVYEKDIRHVKVGQEIHFTVESEPGREFKATIYSVGKSFEKDPKAVHIHAEIEHKKANLLPGMYVRGKIFGESKSVTALPEDAIVQSGGKSYIFTAEKADGNEQWIFAPARVKTGDTYDGWKEIKLLEPLKQGTKVAWNNAYYLEAELKKDDAGHAH